MKLQFLTVMLSFVVISEMYAASSAQGNIKKKQSVAKSLIAKTSQPKAKSTLKADSSKAVVISSAVSQSPLGLVMSPKGSDDELSNDTRSSSQGLTPLPIEISAEKPTQSDFEKIKKQMDDELQEYEQSIQFWLNHYQSIQKKFYEILQEKQKLFALKPTQSDFEKIEKQLDDKLQEYEQSIQSWLNHYQSLQKEFDETLQEKQKLSALLNTLQAQLLSDIKDDKGISVQKKWKTVHKSGDFFGDSREDQELNDRIVQLQQEIVENKRMLASLSKQQREAKNVLDFERLRYEMYKQEVPKILQSDEVKNAPDYESLISEIQRQIDALPDLFARKVHERLKKAQQDEAKLQNQHDDLKRSHGQALSALQDLQHEHEVMKVDHENTVVALQKLLFQFEKQRSQDQEDLKLLAKETFEDIYTLSPQQQNYVLNLLSTEIKQSKYADKSDELISLIHTYLKDFPVDFQNYALLSQQHRDASNQYHEIMMDSSKSFEERQKLTKDLVSKMQQLSVEMQSLKSKWGNFLDSELKSQKVIEQQAAIERHFEQNKPQYVLPKQIPINQKDPKIVDTRRGIAKLYPRELTVTEKVKKLNKTREDTRSMWQKFNDWRTGRNKFLEPKEIVSDDESDQEHIR